MKSTKGQRRSRIGTVLQFFRDGHPDEVRAVFHILAEERLIPESPKPRKARANGAEVIPAATVEKGEGA